MQNFVLYIRVDLFRGIPKISFSRKRETDESHIEIDTHQQEGALDKKKKEGKSGFFKKTKETYNLKF